MSKRFLWLGVLIAALIQTFFLVDMIRERASLIRNGEEVILRSNFVDPRDLFRGHYVTLNLEISRLTDVPTAGDASKEKAGNRYTIWVELEQTEEDGFWTAKTFWWSKPTDPKGPIIAGEYVGMRDKTRRIDFPIDRYFAPKLEAKRLEKFQRDDQLGVILVLSEDGTAAVKGITVAGERAYDEPLF